MHKMMMVLLWWLAAGIPVSGWAITPPAAEKPAAAMSLRAATTTEAKTIHNQMETLAKEARPAPEPDVWENVQFVKVEKGVVYERLISFRPDGTVRHKLGKPLYTEDQYNAIKAAEEAKRNPPKPTVDESAAKTAAAMTKLAEQAEALANKLAPK